VAIVIAGASVGRIGPSAAQARPDAAGPADSGFDDDGADDGAAAGSAGAAAPSEAAPFARRRRGRIPMV
jgi:hypothetical protein